MKRIILSFILISCILLSGCSNDSQAIKNENEKLKNTITQLENKLKEKDSKINELQNNELELSSLPIIYIQNKSSRKFVEKQCNLLALPIDNSIKFRPILENTVIDILDTASVNNVAWLYVSIPVYDSPMNYKGWIKEADTVAYTKDKINKVQSDVKVKKGEAIYETESFDAIGMVKPYNAGIIDHGRIEEKRDGYVKMECPGGKTIWVRESAVIFPELD